MIGLLKSVGSEQRVCGVDSLPCVILFASYCLSGLGPGFTEGENFTQVQRLNFTAEGRSVSGRDVMKSQFNY